MTALQQKIVFDANGQPLEVIIPWAQFCELSEALGLDLDAEGIDDLRETKRAWESGERGDFVLLSDL